MPRYWVVAAPALAAALMVATPARSAECDCTHIAALQAELRNALRLQAAFRAQMAPLQAMGTATSQSAFQQFAEGAARRGLEPVPGNSGGPDHVEYVGYGEGVAVENLDTPSHPGQTRQERQDQLCAMRPSSAAALDAAVRGAACDGIGRAVRAHEERHVSMCRSIGYLPYTIMHGADRAAEEAEAYGAQIAVLRSEIIRIVQRLNPRIIVTSNVRMAPPPNPIYTAVVTEVQAEVTMNRAVVLETGGALLVRFEGQGRQATNSRVEGHCRFTGGMPITHTVSGGIETDGLEARITYSLSGTTPALAMQCRVPGGGTGYGMSMPVPISGGLPEAIKLPLRNGAEQITDMATTPAAALMAQARASLTGDGRFRLVLDCPPP